MSVAADTEAVPYSSLPTDLTNSLEGVVDGLVRQLPELGGAVLLIVAGWLLARLLRASVRRLSGGLLAVVARGLPRQAHLRGEQARNGIAAIAGGFVFWAVWAVFILAALRILELPLLDDTLTTLGSFLPHAFAAVVILFATYLISEVARAGTARATASTDLAHGDLLGRVAQALTLLVGVTVAIDQLGIDSTFLVVMGAILFGSTAFGLALAFGLGAREAVGALLAAHYVQRTYRIGERVAIGEVDGRILEIDDAAVVIETPTGRVHVPARRFLDEVALSPVDDA